MLSLNCSLMGATEHISACTCYRLVANYSKVTRKREMHYHQQSGLQFQDRPQQLYLLISSTVIYKVILSSFVSVVYSDLQSRHRLCSDTV